MTAAIPLDQAMPDMVLAEEVRTSGGSVLLPRATRLTEEHLARLRQREVREIRIVTEVTTLTASTTTAAAAAANTAPASATDQQALREATQLQVQRLFRRAGTDPTMQALCRTVLEYRLEQVG